MGGGGSRGDGGEPAAVGAAAFGALGARAHGSERGDTAASRWPIGCCVDFATNAPPAVFLAISFRRAHARHKRMHRTNSSASVMGMAGISIVMELLLLLLPLLLPRMYSAEKASTDIVADHVFHGATDMV